MKINTYEELLRFAENLIEGKSKINDAEITEGLDFEIKLKGNIWDGSIDFRIAKYILDLQKAIDTILKDADIPIDKNTRPIVKFRVEKGCSLIEVKISDAVKYIMENMSGKQKTFIAIVAILSTVGYFTTSKIIDYQNKIAEQKTNQTIINSYDHAFQEVIKKIPDYEKPMRGLTNNLEKNDTIKSSVNGEKLTKTEIKKQYPGKSKFKAENVYIDGNYLITAIKLETGAITIEEGTHSYDCLSSLTNQELTDLFNKVKNAYTQKKGFTLDLRISAKYFKGSNSLKNLVIYEIGSPRKGAQSISSLLGTQ